MRTTESESKTLGMKGRLRAGTLLLALLTCAQAIGGEHRRSDPARPGVLQRVHPVGGWNPYGGGLLHWWNPHCFPQCGGPDTYCRKPLPNVCWPPYPPYYIWVHPENAHPH